MYFINISNTIVNIEVFHVDNGGRLWRLGEVESYGNADNATPW